MKVPRIRGGALRAVRWAAESTGTSTVVYEVLRRSLRIDALDALPAEVRGHLPLSTTPVRARPEGRPSRGGDLPAPETTTWPRTSDALTSAYRSSGSSPSRVAGLVLSGLAELARRDPCMNILCASDEHRTRRDALASAERYARGDTRGPLDGVPFLVKDEYDVAGLPTRLGSKCEPDTPAAKDSTVVARLAAAGAVFAGKTVLTEYGMSPLGGNASFVMPHNAHDPERAPGGSSTGSAVGVALGLAPIATAGDGGGSIRIPAALNGVFGIKPTFGRVSRAGDGFWGTVAHCGPIGSSTKDLVHFLDAVASEVDPADPLTLAAPPPPKGGFGCQAGAGVKGLRIGIPTELWTGAKTEVATACRIALDELAREGGVLVEVAIPLAAYAAQLGYLTIGPESLAHNVFNMRDRRDLMTEDLRMTFSVLSNFTTSAYLDAQRLRSTLREQVAATLRDVDLIALPTTASTAPPLGKRDSDSPFVDPDALDHVCRFAFLGNLTGLPAATAPIGRDAARLPIGLQILGDAWEEALVLGVLTHLERSGIARAERPASAIDLLA